MPVIIMNRQSNKTVTANNNVQTFAISQGTNFKDQKISLSKLSIPYSWNNITSAFGNKSISYIWTDGAGTSTHSITIPDGFYTISDLNGYIQFVMYNNGHYLVDPNGNNFYFIDIVENSVIYGFTLTCKVVPVALTGAYLDYTNPASISLPVAQHVPQLVIPALSGTGQGISLNLGFPPASYPSADQSTQYQFSSSFVPQIHPISSIYMTCNIVDNSSFNANDQILYTFDAVDETVGQKIIRAPAQYVWYDILDGQFNKIVISFYDQNYNPLVILDPDIRIELLIEKK